MKTARLGWTDAIARYDAFTRIIVPVTLVWGRRSKVLRAAVKNAAQRYRLALYNQGKDETP
jgi:hypothetical protein